MDITSKEYVVIMEQTGEPPYLIMRTDSHRTAVKIAKEEYNHLSKDERKDTRIVAAERPANTYGASSYDRVLVKFGKGAATNELPYILVISNPVTNSNITTSYATYEELKENARKYLLEHPTDTAAGTMRNSRGGYSIIITDKYREVN